MQRPAKKFFLFAVIAFRERKNEIMVNVTVTNPLHPVIAEPQALDAMPQRRVQKGSEIREGGKEGARLVVAAVTPPDRCEASGATRTGGFLRGGGWRIGEARTWWGRALD